ncbi:MAG: tetratricopeptide repeat protein, partial [Bacteroidia bacterium]
MLHHFLTQNSLSAILRLLAIILALFPISLHCQDSETSWKTLQDSVVKATIDWDSPERYENLLRRYQHALPANAPCETKVDLSNLFSEYFSNKRNMDSAGFYTEKALIVLSDCPEKNDAFRSNFNRVKYLFNTGDLPKCVSLVKSIEERGIEIRENLNAQMELYIYYLIALIQLENYSDALYFGKAKTISVMDSVVLGQDAAAIITFNELRAAAAAMRSHNFPEAKKLMQHAIFTQKKYCPEDTVLISRAYHDLGWLYYEEQKYDSAYNIALESEKIFQSFVNPKGYDLRSDELRLQTLLGETRNWMGKPKEGLKHLRKALSIKRNLQPGNTRSYSKASFMLKIADAFSFVPKNDSAITYYQKALYHYTNDFVPGDKPSVPLASDLRNNSRLMRICLNNYSKALLRRARINKTSEAWQTAYLAQRLAVISLERARERVAPDSRVILANLGRKTYEQAIGLAFEMAEATSADSLYQIAFDWAEAAKAFELRMNLQDAEVAFQTQVPDELIREGRSLKLARNYYENEYKSMSLIPYPDSIRLLKAEKKMLKAQVALRKWEDKMQGSLPSEDAQQALASLSASQVSSNLKSSEALLSFFYGDSAVYAFLVKPDGLQARRIGSRMEMDELLRPLLDNLA